MLRLALLSSRGRLATFTGALIALTASSVLVMAGTMQLEAALKTHPPVERYAAAKAVVTGQQIVGSDHDVVLGERARVSSALSARLAAVPGVRAAIGDVSVPARLGGRAAAAHGVLEVAALVGIERRVDRIERDHRGQAGCAPGLDQVARGDLGAPDAAANGRADLGPLDVEPRGGHRRLRGAKRRRAALGGAAAGIELLT